MVFTWSAVHKKLIWLPSQKNQCCFTCKRLYYKILTSKGVFVLYLVQIWLFYYSIAQRRNVDVSHFGNSLLSRYCISRCGSVGNAVGLESWGCWFEPTVHHYFSSNNVCLLDYSSLQVKTHSQNNWSMTNQKRVYRFQTRFLSLVYL